MTLPRPLPARRPVQVRKPAEPAHTTRRPQRGAQR
jgi:hypothetical protein